MENTRIYEIHTDVSMFNERGVLKPSSYQALIMRIVERNLSDFHSNFDETMKYNLAWALVSLTLEVQKPAERCTRLLANTWYPQRRGPFFRREFIFRNERGEVLFKSATYSVLLDVENRTVFRQPKLPFDLPEPSGEMLITAEPTARIRPEYVPVFDSEVCPSYIDWLGHMNNCRYGDLAYDALTDGERESLAGLKRMEIYFTAELKKGDAFTVFKAREGDRLCVRGQAQGAAASSFDLVMYFSRPPEKRKDGNV